MRRGKTREQESERLDEEGGIQGLSRIDYDQEAESDRA